jgi:hypothetical protein
MSVGSRFAGNRMLFSVIIVTSIFIVSIVVAYIAFNILESSAEANLQNWRFGGAFAGFVFTASLMASLAFQFYKQMTVDEVAKYRNQAIELQSKLIRGAPCPKDYTIEVDEKNKIVFSRPVGWVPRNHILHQYKEIENRSDPQPALFTSLIFSKLDLVIFFEKYRLGSFDADNIDVDTLYNKFSQGWQKFLVEEDKCKNLHTTEERIRVDGIESQRSLYNYTDKERTLLDSVIITYVPRFEAMYVFVFTDDDKDYRKSSQVFENIRESIRFLP